MTERDGCHVYYIMPSVPPRLVYRWSQAVYIGRHYDTGIFVDTGTGIQGPFGSADAARAAIRVATGEMV